MLISTAGLHLPGRLHNLHNSKGLLDVFDLRGFEAGFGGELGPGFKGDYTATVDVSEGFDIDPDEIYQDS